jgi:hypothetical protein
MRAGGREGGRAGGREGERAGGREGENLRMNQSFSQYPYAL